MAHNEVREKIMQRLTKTVMLLGAMGLACAATTAEAAVAVHHTNPTAVVVRPGPLPNTVVKHRGTTVARTTPYRPLVGPQLTHHGHTTTVRVR